MDNAVSDFVFMRHKLEVICAVIKSFVPTCRRLKPASCHHLEGVYAQNEGEETASLLLRVVWPKVPQEMVLWCL